MNCNGGGPPFGGEFQINTSMENKPIITCAGDSELFATLENNLVRAIPQDLVEWHRSFSRPVKKVRLAANFIPFSREILPTEKDWHLIKQPIFHIYWTECTDVDVYKSSVRDNIDTWLKTLAQYNIQDWMIVLVETYDLKKSNKLLPRTTVLDKIRSDFASKHGDRCLSIINPIKSESRSAESWRGLIGRIRHLMLTAYDKTLNRFGEVIKEQRERRNQPGWNFCHYFLLQEELAFVLQMLGLYDEALVQYDELDALFTQFVLNSNMGDTPGWLNLFQSPLNNWAGVNLNNNINHRLRLLLAECKASLLDLRSYLFSRQCAMLLLLNKPWEIAQRCLSFVHNTLSELRILEIQRPEGSVECWTFLCALEVLQACQLAVSKTDNSQQLLDSCSLHTASLWALARDKLGDLGKLCGLMPGNEPTSEQLHTVVYLIAGMGDSEPQPEGKLSPIDKLKEALSSKEVFKKQYLEHAELAMGTYKHVGRIRSARLIGKELARFYLELGEIQKAIAFLLEALKTYTNEGWYHLASQTQLELAECYKRMDDVEKYIKTCSCIASTDTLHFTIRSTYFEEMLAYMKMLPRVLLTELNDNFQILNMEVNVTDKVVQDCVVNVIINIQSLLPRDVKCTKASISTEEIMKPPPVPKKKGPKNSVNDPQVELLSSCTIENTKPLDITLTQLPTEVIYDYNEDKSLGFVQVIGRTMKAAVRRSDSVKHRRPSFNAKGDFSKALNCTDVILKPGLNTLTLTKRVDQPGLYKVGQLSLLIEDKLEFLSPMLHPRLCYEVAQTLPTIALKCTRDLLAGLVQDLELIISSGSVNITKNMSLKLRTSRGLTVQSSNKEMVRELETTLTPCEPFQTTKVQLKVLADLPPKKDSSSMEHEINIQCPWGAEESIQLHFGPPLMSKMKLHTAKHRKFVQIHVTGLTTQLLQLTEPQLITNASLDVNFKNINPVAGQKLLIGNGINVSFMWELELGRDEKSTMPIKTDFRVKYMPIYDKDFSDDSTTIDDDPLHIHKMEEMEKSSNIYRCNFDIVDYVTLFTVSSKVESGGSAGEFCRAGSMCHLCLTVKRMLPNPVPNPPPQLMYEVLADQTMWAVCGRTAGIISLETSEKQTVTLDVMPLTSGYLPLPAVRLSRYIPAADLKNDLNRKGDVGFGPRLEPFSPGQVYNASKAMQVHVLPAVPSESN